ncbi:MAG: hypothetical protein N2110_05120 [Flavobacteriales bacterium]|nr:hypothetical protein [Flavobacteriales bacterium]
MKKIFFGLLVGGAFFLYSCSKPLENKIRGTWRVENPNYPAYPKIAGDYTVWRFEGGTLVIRYENDSNTVDSCTYAFKRKFARRYIVISCEKASKALMGAGTKDWEIVRLKKDQLRLAYGLVDNEGRQKGLEQYDLKKIAD